MAKYLARPLNADGTEWYGTSGVLSGEYKSLDNFRRYKMERHAGACDYVIFRIRGIDWTPVGYHLHADGNAARLHSAARQNAS